MVKVDPNLEDIVPAVVEEDKGAEDVGVAVELIVPAAGMPGQNVETES